MPGYISLHRDIQKHWLYSEERVFSRYEAWLDILMRANHSEGKAAHNGTLETVLRGSTIWSMGDMEKHWKWSNSKVRAFLKRLENDGMISVNSTTKKTYLTVINYDFYQDLKKEETPLKHHQSTTETYQKHTNNNVNNVNTKDIYMHWNSKKIIVHKEFTQTMQETVNARLNVHSIDVLIEAINNYHSILISDMHYYSHKFILKEFMNPKNLDKFITENNPFETFKKNNVGISANDREAQTAKRLADQRKTQEPQSFEPLYEMDVSGFGK